MPAPTLIDPADSRVLIIGASRFAADPDLPDLPSVPAGVREMCDTLLDPVRCGIERSACQVLIDPESPQEVDRILNRLADEARQTLLVYYSGHGIPNPDDGSLCLAVGQTERSSAYATAWPLSWLQRAVRRSPAVTKVVVLDCCFSGRAVQTMSGGDVAAQAASPGSIVMAASPANRLAAAPEGERYTAFTGAFLDTLRSGVEGGPEYLDLDTIYANVRRVLLERGMSEPQVERINQASSIALGRNVAFRQAAAPVVSEPGAYERVDVSVTGSPLTGYAATLEALGRRARGPIEPFEGPFAIAPPVDDMSVLVRYLAGHDGAPIDEYGARLFRALFPDGELLTLYRDAQATAREHGRGVRIDLRLASPLDLLPWELLFDRPRFLAQGRSTPVVRRHDVDHGWRTLATALPLRVLAMVAEHDDGELQRGLVERALAPLVEQGAVELRWLAGSTLRELQREVDRGEDFHVFHCIGEGLDGDRLAALLCDSRSVRLAVLCGADPDVDAALVEHGVPAVVALRLQVTNESVLAFADELYASLTDGDPIEVAVTRGRRAIAAGHDVEWAVPVLHLSVDDGQLFELDDRAPAPAIAAAPADEPPASNLEELSEAMERLAKTDRKVAQNWSHAQTAKPEMRGRFLLRLGRALAERSELPAAAAALRTMLDDPDDVDRHPHAWLELGMVEERLAHRDEAMALYRKAIDHGSADVAEKAAGRMARLRRRGGSAP